MERALCQKCGLWQGCKIPLIHGRGAVPARVMFIGEAPGADEDEAGEVYVGMSGRLLNLALETYRIPEDQIYRTNIIRCRPPHNKLTNEKLRIACCQEFLLEELRRVAPEIIVPMGKRAIGAIVGSSAVQRLHGRIIEQDGFLIYPLYHPAAVLHNPGLQSVFNDDFRGLAKLVKYGKMDPEPVDTKVVRNLAEVMQVFADVIDRGYTSYDYETNFLRPWERDNGPPVIGTVAFSLGTHKARCIPIDHPQHVWTDGERATLLEALRMVLQSPDIVRVCQNAQYEHTATKAVLGYEPGLSRDTMIQHSHIDEESWHNLDDLSWRYTDLGGYDGDFAAQLPDPKNYLSADLDRLGYYTCCDVMVTERLDKHFRADLSEGQLRILEEVQYPLVKVLSRVALRGKAVDEAKVASLSTTYLETAAELEKEMRAWPEVVAAETLLAANRVQKGQGKLRDQLLALEDELEALERTAEDAKAAADRAETVLRRDDAARAKQSPRSAARLILGLGSAVRADAGLAVARTAERAARLAATRKRRSFEYRTGRISQLDARDPECRQREWRAFNFRSDDQLRVLMLDPACFGLPETRYLTDSGKYSIGKDSMLAWSEEHEKPRVLRRFRRIRHIHSHFIRPIPQLLDNADRMLHASYLQHVARTGRLASRSPNEQNRPRDDTCMQLGVPPIQSSMYVSRYRGGKIIKGDFSQLELKLMASTSESKEMLEGYRMGWDLHAMTTLRLFPHLVAEGAKAGGVGLITPAAELPFERRVELAKMLGVGWKQQRTIGKRCNFLTGYGGSGYALQAILAESGLYLSVEECQQYVEGFFAVYPEVKQVMARTVAKAVVNGGDVVAVDGRVRHLPALVHGNEKEAGHAAREAGNFPIQWLAAKLTLVAMLLLEDLLEGSRTMVVGNIHDAIILDAPEEDVEDAQVILREAMEAAAFDVRWAPEGWLHPDVTITADIEVV